MEAKCPHCFTAVMPQFDERCPNCNVPLKAPTASELDYANEPQYSTIPPPAATGNPYQSPKYFAEEEPGVFDRAPQRSVGWVLFGFDGRIPRRVYWLATIGTTVLFYMCAFAIGEFSQQESEAAGLAMLALYIPFIWTWLAVEVKRWHDRDKSGWWVLISIVPLIGPIWQFVETGCLRGTVGPNNYGPDPT